MDFPLLDSRDSRQYFCPRLRQIKHFNRDEFLPYFCEKIVCQAASAIAIATKATWPYLTVFVITHIISRAPLEWRSKEHTYSDAKMLNTCQANADDNANEIIFTTFTLRPAMFHPHVQGLWKLRPAAV